MNKISDQLGEALIKEGLVDENQLQHALQIQQDSLEKKRLGQVLIELGYLTKRQLREVSRKYNFRQQIGEVLVEQELVTEEQLAEALDEQRATRKPIGEILVEKELISRQEYEMRLLLPCRLSLQYLKLFSRTDQSIMDQVLLLVRQELLFPGHAKEILRSQACASFHLKCSLQACSLLHTSEQTLRLN